VGKHQSACRDRTRDGPTFTAFCAMLFHDRSYVHSVLSHGIILWGNSSHSECIFRNQKRIIRVIMGSGRRDSCRELFRHLNTLPLYSQYMFSVLLFIIKNRDQFLSNSEVQNISTRYNSNLHLPLENLTLHQKGVFYAGIKIYSHLPSIVKDLSNDGKCFKIALKGYLLDSSFYSLEEYFN
jgi:hypothetical protein